jgi:hypothetical protein
MPSESGWGTEAGRGMREDYWMQPSPRPSVSGWESPWGLERGGAWHPAAPADHSYSSSKPSPSVDRSFSLPPAGLSVGLLASSISLLSSFVVLVLSLQIHNWSYLERNLRIPHQERMFQACAFLPIHACPHTYTYKANAAQSFSCLSPILRRTLDWPFAFIHSFIPRMHLTRHSSVTWS